MNVYIVRCWNVNKSGLPRLWGAYTSRREADRTAERIIKTSTEGYAKSTVIEPMTVPYVGEDADIMTTFKVEVDDGRSLLHVDIVKFPLKASVLELLAEAAE